MTDITPYSGGMPAAPRFSGVSRRAARAVEQLRASALVRMADVRAEEMVQSEKLASVDHLTSVAMSGHAIIVRQREALAAGDPLLADELRLFTDSARILKAQVLADFVCNVRHR